MERRFLLKLLLCLGLSAGCCAVAKAQITIDANFTTSNTSAFPGSTPIASSTTAMAAATIEATIDAAIDQITTNVTCTSPITLNIDFVSDPNIDLGESNYYVTDIPYSEYLSNLQANPNKSANDVTALASLPAGPSSGINGNASQVQMGGALLDAIGDTTDANSIFSADNGFAGTVALNMTEMNLSRANDNEMDYDLESTVMHEVDEVLGIGGAGSTLGQGLSTPPAGIIGALDLFRFQSAGSRSFTTSSNAHAYFSIDDGNTDLVNFNQFAGGDFADWGDGAVPADGNPNTPPQVQDAYTYPQDEPNLGPNELTALDVVGWNLTPAGMALDAIPEPDSGWLIAGGVIAAGLWQMKEKRGRLRRRKEGSSRSRVCSSRRWRAGDAQGRSIHQDADQSRRELV